MGFRRFGTLRHQAEGGREEGRGRNRDENALDGVGVQKAFLRFPVSERLWREARVTFFDEAIVPMLII